jgi:hypothetical protein
VLTRWLVSGLVLDFGNVPEPARVPVSVVWL